MQFTKKQKVAAVLGAGAVAVAGSGVAFAVWTDVSQPSAVTGTVGKNGDTLTLTTSNGSGAAAALPTTLNGSTKVYVSAQNKTNASQTLTKLTPVLTVSPAGACSVGIDDTTKDFTIDDSNISIASVPGGQTVSQGYYTITLNSQSANQDSCQGAGLSLAITGS